MGGGVALPKRAESLHLLHTEAEAVKLARLLSYRCLGLGATRCTSPEITHADAPFKANSQQYS